MSKKFEGKTLEEAYEKASSVLKHSLNELDIEIIQNPSKGLFGFFSKQAIIKAKVNRKNNTYHKKEYKKEHHQNINIDTLSSRLDGLNLKEDNFENNINDNEIKISQIEKNKIFDEFYDRKNNENKNDIEYKIERKNNTDIEIEIKKQIDKLFSHLCYKLDDIKVKQIDKKTIYIKFDGVDSALLIGKEGYRYKALSYILFNWINDKYDLTLKLEIAEFLENQEKNVLSYVDSIIDIIEDKGYFKTKTFDNVSLHIALTSLREKFPNKYVAIKVNQKQEKYILINEYKK